MTHETKHTPLPWVHKQYEDGYEVALINGQSIWHAYESDYHPPSTDDSAFICRAVNCHDELVAALELALQHLVYDGKHPAVVAAKQALAKARGEA